MSETQKDSSVESLKSEPPARTIPFRFMDALMESADDAD